MALKPFALALGAALLVGVAAPNAAAATQLQSTDPAQMLSGLDGAVKYGVAPVGSLRLDPWANSSADPLTNGVAVQPDNPGMRPIATTAVTRPLSGGGGAKDLLPLLGGLTGH